MGKPPSATLACIECAKSKRRCSKQQPGCIRCKSRGLLCQYPPTRPSIFVPLVDGDLANTQKVSKTSKPSGEKVIGSKSQVDCGESAEKANPVNGCSISWWFTRADTWLIDQAPGGVKRTPPTSEDVHDALNTVRRWLQLWISGENNPLFHGTIYRRCFPICLQDAFLALSTYFSRTPGSESMIISIILDKSLHLVNGASDPTATGNLDPLQLLARAQALLIYQIIGLYDGNIRLRHVAEKHILVLSSWMHAAVDRAQDEDQLGRYVCINLQESVDLEWQKSVWYSWILAESIRRTWLMISMVQGMYMSSRDGVDHCLGGMMFTSRAGFWDAPNAFAWQQKCTELYGGLVRLTDIDQLFANVDAKQLDEFAELVLKVTFGSEQLERWKTGLQ